MSGQSIHVLILDVRYVEVDMFSQPTPITLLKSPTTQHMHEKEKFESDKLENWL